MAIRVDRNFNYICSNIFTFVEFFRGKSLFFCNAYRFNLQTSFLTPPMAMSAYYLKGVQTKNVELMEIFRGIMPS